MDDKVRVLKRKSAGCCTLYYLEVNGHLQPHTFVNFGQHYGFAVVAEELEDFLKTIAQHFGIPKESIPIEVMPY